MQSTAHAFKANAKAALGNAQLQKGVSQGTRVLVDRRAVARANMPEFEELRTIGRDIKDHTLAHLDLYLATFAKNARAAGSHVHFAGTAADARAIILDICKAADARLVTKGKSMVSEEIGLNAHLEAAGLEVVETDLGEYIIQNRGEAPSHIIAPAIHLTKEDVETDFRRLHTSFPKGRDLTEAKTLVNEARTVLREAFLKADVGITGANFLIAETGSTVIVTNEGNGDLTQSMARVHVVITSIEKVLPTLEDFATIARLLARSATGQEFSTYTTLSTGPRRATDPDGPQACHIVILDNGRSDILASDMKEVLRCIRCGACMNHCPVYNAIGGHAYGWVYPGPIGSVLTPSMLGVKEAGNLPNASTFCGRCEEVCPMQIPLPKLMRQHREAEFDQHLLPRSTRVGLKVWAYLARWPSAYHIATRFGVMAGKIASGGRGVIGWVPGGRGWTKHRDFPAPQGRTFQQLWAETKRGVPRR